jgi:uncharacterized protein YxeA
MSLEIIVLVIACVFIVAHLSYDKKTFWNRFNKSKQSNEVVKEQGQTRGDDYDHGERL